MLVTILHNFDHDLLEEDPGREARKDVLRVAGALADALAQNGVAAQSLAIGANPLSFVETLQRQQPDLVVNLCESLAGDSRGEMTVPCILELLGIPYTGSSSLALGLALHKDKAKELLLARGIPTPDFCVLHAVDEVAAVRLPFPLIVKPIREDASIGIDFDSVVLDRMGLRRATEQVLSRFHQPALVERFIEGREIYVSILGNNPRQALPLTEIRFGKAFENKPNIVSYRAKWALTSDECADSPAQISVLDSQTESRVAQTALTAFQALDCQDYGRVDVRLSPQGEPHVIDINPNCDLHPDAGFAKSAAAAGLDYPTLAMRLVQVALERSHGNSSHLKQRQQRPERARGVARPNRDVLAARGGLRPRAHRPRAQAE